MTAKRFTVVEYLPNVVRIEDNYQKLNGHEIVDLLNALHEENKELKKENAQFDILIKNNQLAYIDLEKENEQLKSEINMLKNTIARNELYIEKLTHKGEWSN